MIVDPPSGGRCDSCPSEGGTTNFFPSCSHDLAIVERKTLRADDLFGFMSLAGNQHAIAGVSFRQRPRDRGLAIGFNAQRRQAGCESSQDVFDDSLRVFRAGCRW